MVSAISPKVSWSLLLGKGTQGHGPGMKVLTAGHRVYGDTRLTWHLSLMLPNQTWKTRVENIVRRVQCQEGQVQGVRSVLRQDLVQDEGSGEASGDK